MIHSSMRPFGNVSSGGLTPGNPRFLLSSRERHHSMGFQLVGWMPGCWVAWFASVFGLACQSRSQQDPTIECFIGASKVATDKDAPFQGHTLMYAYVRWRMRGYQPECHGHATSSSKRQEKTPICHSSFSLVWMNRLEDGTRSDFHTEVSEEDVQLAF